jgi:allantoate deiminase
MDKFKSLAAKVMAWCEELGAITQSPGMVDRRYLTPEHKTANNKVSAWMQHAGMSTWQDAAGNQWGRYACEQDDAPRLLLGSHLDTVPNGGKYDGMLGVVTPIAIMEYCHQHNLQFPFHIDIVGFGDEEGTRFGSTLLGSRALTGTWPQQWAELTDAHGISLRQAMANFGLDFDNVHSAKQVPSTLLAYCEIHIEQGPVLEKLDLPVGWVTAIAGAKRFNFTLKGCAGHAGTVPMTMRQDALAAASEMILAIEKIAIEFNVVATVGKIENSPNGVNVIPGKVTFSLDIRSEHDNQRDAALEQIMLSINEIAQRRGILIEHQPTHSANAVHCDQGLSALLATAIEQNGYTPLAMPSGAGHDAMAIADICPVSMLFVRCEKGISHNPAEAITTDDIEASLNVFFQFLQLFKDQQRDK